MDKRVFSNIKLKSKTEIEKIFNQGNVLISSDKKIRAHYLIQHNTNTGGINSAVAVSHKAGKAVWRNRAKRILREANRLNNNDLLNYCTKKQVQLSIVFSINSLKESTAKNIFLKDINSSMVEILKKVKEELKKSTA